MLETILHNVALIYIILAVTGVIVRFSKLEAKVDLMKANDLDHLEKALADLKEDVRQITSWLIHNS